MTKIWIPAQDLQPGDKYGNLTVKEIEILKKMVIVWMEEQRSVLTIEVDIEIEIEREN